MSKPKMRPMKAEGVVDKFGQLVRVRLFHDPRIWVLDAGERLARVIIKEVPRGKGKR